MDRCTRTFAEIPADPPKSRHLIAFLAGVLLVVTGSAGATNQIATEWQSLDEIRTTAENYLKIASGLEDDRLTPTAGHLDPRLKLPRCTQALEAFVRPGAQISGRTIVGVRCSGGKPWKIYIPVHAALMQEVLVARDPMPRGYRVQARDLELALRDVSGMTGGYLTSSRDIVDQRLTRAVAKGVVMTSAHLQADVMVKRGQSVTLTILSDALNIRMMGKALSDGLPNQRIRVENLDSGKIVEGIVRSAQQVEVLVH